ncbi:uncharacterized protein LOC133814737 [Humulus lupulus]|uniref:uncharacterized protein LOC133814737 n=1 Tax=Humulus lupulus TaxID=3486 RepID=UPI002B400C32|nr:uncharacterized protein LOC133814737 [Humulus lupulus]
MPMKQPKPQLNALNQFMKEKRASIRSLEMQIGQLANLMTNRAQENLPSTTEVNPKEQCLAITLRSGTQYEEPKRTQSEEIIQEKKDQGIENKDSSEEKVTDSLPEKEVVPPVSIENHIKIPYPQRLRKHNLDKQFAKFLEVLKKIHINISFAEALEQMPNYVKFMKEIMSYKRKMGDYETLPLIEECSAILQRKLLKNL